MASMMKVLLCALLLVLNAPNLEGVSSSAKEHVELLTCTGDNDVPCIQEDSTNSLHLGYNTTVEVKMRLSAHALQELLFDTSKVALVSINRDIIQGTQLIEHGSYGDRLNINWSIELASNGWGLLKLILFLQNLEYRDRRLLHLEVRTKNVIYQTKEKEWFNVIKEDPSPDPQINIPSDENIYEKGVPHSKSWQTVPREISRMERQLNRSVQLQEHLNHYMDINQEEPTEESKVLQEIKKMMIFLLFFIVVTVSSFVGFKVYMHKKGVSSSKSTCVHTTLINGDHLWMGWGSTGTQISPRELEQCIIQDSQDLVVPPGNTAIITCSEIQGGIDVATEAKHLLDNKLQYELIPTCNLNT